jgi:hypothetical protein
MGPSFLLSIFLSYEFIIFSIFFVNVSLPHINTGRVTVLYNRILVNRWVCLDFSVGNNAWYDLFALHILLIEKRYSLAELTANLFL